MLARRVCRLVAARDFVFMGFQIGDQRSGILRQDLEHLWAPTVLDWNPTVNGIPVAVRKGKVESPIHRLGLVDEVYLAVPNRDGQGITPIHIIGLFTYRAVTQTSRHVPVLRRILAEILKAENPPKAGSFRYKRHLQCVRFTSHQSSSSLWVRQRN